jgi:hypothetical protein
VSMKIGSFEAALAEAEDETYEFDLCGETFEIAGSAGAIPIIKFAHAAQSGLDTAEMQGMAAMYEMLKYVLKPDEYRDLTEEEYAKWEEGQRADAERDGVTNFKLPKPPRILLNSEWGRFQACANENRIGGDTLLEICKVCYQSLTGKASPMPAKSLAGHRSTTKKSRSGSSRSRTSAKVVEEFPDIQVPAEFTG